MRYKVVQLVSGVVRVFEEIDSFVEKKDGFHPIKKWDEDYKEFTSWIKAMNFVYDRNDSRHPVSGSLFSHVIYTEVIDV